MIKVYAFDFDGVLVENHNELPYFVRIAWKKVTNRECKVTDSDIIRFRPFVRNAVEIYCMIALLENDVHVTRHEIQRIASSDKENAEKFAHFFYESRRKMQEENKFEWLKLFKKMDFAVNLFNSLSGKNKVYIVTSKDKKSIVHLIEHFRIRINEDFILAKEVSFDKLNHMNIIREREKVNFSDIVFIDDAIDHLKPLASLGINLILASWGYTTEDDIKEAKELGIKIATKDNFEKVVRSL